MKKAVESRAGGECSIDTLLGAVFVPDPAIFLNVGEGRGLCEGPESLSSCCDCCVGCAVFGRRLGRLEDLVLTPLEVVFKGEISASLASSPILFMSLFDTDVLSGAKGLVNIGLSPIAPGIARSIGETTLGKYPLLGREYRLLNGLFVREKACVGVGGAGGTDGFKPWLRAKGNTVRSSSTFAPSWLSRLFQRRLISFYASKNGEALTLSNDIQ
jgi:hypothetical protein